MQVKFDLNSIEVRYPDDYPWEQKERFKSENVFTVLLDKNGSEAHKKEYAYVEKIFLGSLDRGATIVSIKRIQNKELYDRFYHAKENIRKKYAGMTITGVSPRYEEHMFHGTNTTQPHIIYKSKEGVDRRYTYTAKYGLGAYFAVKSAYSNSSGYIHVSK